MWQKKKKKFTHIVLSDQLASIHEAQQILLISVLFPSSSWHHKSICVQHLLLKEYPFTFVIYTNLKLLHKLP